jgi:hypothetical protein
LSYRQLIFVIIQCKIELPKLKKAKTISRKFQDIESYIFSKSTIMRIPGVFISSAKSTISQIIIMSYYLKSVICQFMSSAGFLLKIDIYKSNIAEYGYN